MRIIFNRLGLFSTLIIFSCLSFSIPTATPQAGKSYIDQSFQQNDLEEQSSQETSENNVYLPTIQTPHHPFIGIMMPVYWSKENVSTFLPEVDGLAGIQHTSVGWGIDIQDPALVEPWDTDEALNRNNLYRQLEQLWQKGYVSFIKIGSSTPIKAVVNGEYDAQLTQMANIYLRWVNNGGGRKAMFAPFQEMNGEWVPYYSSGSSALQRQKEYKDAYLYVLNMFQKNGVDRSMIWWVFSPNGGSGTEDQFEYYYPGNDLVDMVGFASYNFGFCDATVKPDGTDYGYWENYDRIYKPYIERMKIMAPQKYILISETGTSALTSKQAREERQYDYIKKAEWLVENYQYLSSEAMVLGVYYFDFNDLGNNVMCDLAIPRSNFTGYREAVANSGFRYLTIEELRMVIH